MPSPIDKIDRGEARAQREEISEQVPLPDLRATASEALREPVVAVPPVVDFYWLDKDGKQSERFELADPSQLPGPAKEVADFFSSYGLPLGFVIADQSATPYKVGIPYPLEEMAKEPQKIMLFEAHLALARGAMPEAIGYQVREDYYKVYDEPRAAGPETMKMWIVVIDPAKESKD